MLLQLEALRGGATRIPFASHLELKQPRRHRPDGVNMVRCRMAEPSGKPAPMGKKTHYKDSWLDNTILSICMRRLGNVTGVSTTKKGYDGFVELTRKVMETRSPLLQRASSMRVLHSAIPPWLLKIIRRFLPNNQKTAETFAAATLYAEWLVGPCEVKEVEVNGTMQKSGVLIKKCRYVDQALVECQSRYDHDFFLASSVTCYKSLTSEVIAGVIGERYLESSNCVGMCVNLCKIPTQDFFTNSLGVPLTMTPNFEDMSCEMIYGQTPPSIEEDPALQQPCFATLCPTARKKALTCSKTPLPP
uniref:Beta-carotene isomerase D27-like C-terminal domain-containing protein n=1 Tax=Physcomitrium patens TaxID=3218 RepID=A0A7I4EJB9_PHYPA